MTYESFSMCTEQHVVIIFLVSEGVKPMVISRRRQAQYVFETLSCSKTLEWGKHFKDGCPGTVEASRGST